MKACFIESYGDSSVLKVGNLPAPDLKRNEVLVELHAAALNHLDIWVRMGRPGDSLSMPHIIGSDGAGIVRRIGPDVRRIPETAEVLLNPGVPCGRCDACYAGDHSQCESYGILGLSRPGTFAQYVAVPEEQVYRKPTYLSFEEAAAFPLTFLTAWRMVVTKGAVKPGQMVLIHGIGGGVAQAALQFALMAGAETIVTSSIREKLDKAIQMGAHHTILYTEESVEKYVWLITAGKGVDLIVDTVGAKTMDMNLDMVCKGGCIVLCGVTSGAQAEINLQKLYWKQVQLLGSTMGTAGEFKQMLDAICHHNLKPVIDSVYPLDEVRIATEKMESGSQYGKLVLTID